jgi:hypothetical protein
MTTQKPVKKKGMIVVFFLFILIPVIWFLFLNKNSDVEMAAEKLTGSWLRSDGPYSISISNVEPEGKLEAAYFNPNPINVGRSEWGMQDKKLLLYVEMDDVNYKGSNYRLTYIEKSDQLVGYYFQAGTNQTYDVSFSKNK